MIVWLPALTDTVNTWEDEIVLDWPSILTLLPLAEVEPPNTNVNSPSAAAVNVTLVDDSIFKALVSLVPL